MPEISARGRPFLPALEITRGVAALLVLIYHARAKLLDTSYFSFGALDFVNVLNPGTRGVDIFSSYAVLLFFAPTLPTLGSKSG